MKEKATKLHQEFCSYNHTDYCMWYYREDDWGQCDHDGESFVANPVEVNSYVEDFYGEGDFIEYLFSFNSTDRERAKTEVCKKISSIIKQIVIMGINLGEIVDNLKDM